MIITKDLLKIQFGKLMGGSLTFITDGDSSRNAKVGDFIGVNEWDKDSGYTGRCCLVKISDIEECEDCYIYAVQPCRIDTHCRISAEVYPSEEAWDKTYETCKTTVLMNSDGGKI